MWSGRHRARAVVMAVALAMGTLALCSPSDARPPPPDRVDRPDRPDRLGRPDVLLVVTDDQRQDTVRHMPRVQRLLVDRGTTFTRAQVPTPLCCPSRASLLTGLYAHDTGVFSNGRPDGGWWAFHEQGHEQRTVVGALHAAGYRTGLFGKYFNAYARWSAPSHRPPGWDHFLTFRTLRRSGSYFGYRLSDGRRHGSGTAAYSTDVLARAAERFVRATPRNQPLFVYFAPYAPHAPSVPAPRHAGAWTDRLPRHRPVSATEDVEDKPAWVRRLTAPTQASVDTARARQQESLMAVDEAVGGLVQALADTGRLSNTLVVYLSDNGLLLGEHHIMGKGAPYAEALSVPLVVRWDGRVQASRTDDRLALNLDVPATIAEAAAVRFPTDGLSLLAGHDRRGFVLEGAADPKLARPAFCGWRTAEWTYVRWATGEEELYSQRGDPHQLRNLATDASRRPVRDALRSRAVRHCAPEPPGFDW